MFESLHHWFTAIKNSDHLLDDSTDAELQIALAATLYHLVNSDNKITPKERLGAEKFLSDEFDLDSEKAAKLFKTASNSTLKLEDDLNIINDHLKAIPLLRMRFLSRLLQLADIDGIDQRELDVFYQALHRVFPEVREIGGEKED